MPTSEIPAWIRRSRHPSEHILYSTGLKRSFDITPEIEYAIFSILVNWAFENKHLQFVEHLVKLNNMALQLALQFTRESSLPSIDVTYRPHLCNSGIERVCWLFDICHICKAPAKTSFTDIGCPKTGEVYTILTCGDLNACARETQFIKMNSKIVEETNRTPVRRVRVASSNGAWALCAFGGDWPLRNVYRKWKAVSSPLDSGRARPITHMLNKNNKCVSVTLQLHSAEAIYADEMQRRNEREKKIMLFIADLVNGTEDIKFPKMLKDIVRTEIWGLCYNKLKQCIRYERVRRLDAPVGANYEMDDSDDSDDESAFHVFDQPVNVETMPFDVLFSRAIDSCTYIVYLIHGLRCLDAAYSVASQCGERGSRLILDMAIECSLAIEVIGTQLWKHRSGYEGRKKITVVQAILTMTPSDRLRTNKNWIRPAQVRIVMTLEDFQVGFPGVAVVPTTGYATKQEQPAVLLISDRVQFKTIFSKSLISKFVSDVLPRAIRRASAPKKPRNHSCECTHNYMSPMRFYSIAACTRCSKL